MQAQIFNYKTWISETNPDLLKKQLEACLNASNLTILNFVEHHFEPQGFTAVWVLAESHLAIHTFPEAGKTYLELSSCNEAKNQEFQNILAQQINLI